MKNSLLFSLHIVNILNYYTIHTIIVNIAHCNFHCKYFSSISLETEVFKNSISRISQYSHDGSDSFEDDFVLTRSILVDAVAGGARGLYSGDAFSGGAGSLTLGAAVLANSGPVHVQVGVFIRLS